MLDEEPVPFASADDGLKNRKLPSKGGLGVSSRRYDAEGKGYLDEDEQFVRKYDTNNDGVFDLEEVKKIARDYREEIVSKQQFKTMFIVCALLLFVSFAGNFGLTWATVTLTRKLDSQGGDLTDTSGNRIATKSKGDVVGFIPSGSLKDGARHLEEEVPFGTLEETKAQVRGLYSDYVDGTPVTVTVTDSTTNVNYSYTVKRIASQAKDQELDNKTCDIYNGVVVEESSQTFVTKCCDADPCNVYVDGATRRLITITCPKTRTDCHPFDFFCACECFDDCDDCFSPMSTVVEKSKGKMFLKDLQFGDSVLASNGVYQPFVFDMHSSPSKQTTFVQIHTESSKNVNESPLEATSKHFVFIDGLKEPVPAGNIKVGDLLVGLNGPRKVTKVTAVTRKGFFDPLTADATLFVDGVLASSVAQITELLKASIKKPNYLNFGFFKVHIHTFMGLVIAPLFQAVCTKVDSKYCETRIDHGDEGSWNVLIDTGRVILGLHPMYQGLLLILLPSLGALSLVTYYLFKVAAFLTFAVGGIMLAQQMKLCKKDKVA